MPFGQKKIYSSFLALSRWHRRWVCFGNPARTGFSEPKAGHEPKRPCPHDQVIPIPGLRTEAFTCFLVPNGSIYIGC